MTEFILDHLWECIFIFFAGAGSYVISTLSGGGGSLLLVPVITFFLGGKSTAPVANLGNLIGEPVRIFLFLKHIRWKVTAFYVPSALAGTVFGAWIFTTIKVEWLQLLIGIFLISTIFQFRFGERSRSFEMKPGWFIPLGFIVSFVTTLIGSAGPVLNPFYLNYGIEKEELIATKTMNSFIVGLAQISSYVALGALNGELWIYGIILGLGAATGNWIGKLALKRASNKLFRKSVIAVMVISGIVLVFKSSGFGN